MKNKWNPYEQNENNMVVKFQFFLFLKYFFHIFFVFFQIQTFRIFFIFFHIDFILFSYWFHKRKEPIVIFPTRISSLKSIAQLMFSKKNTRLLKLSSSGTLGYDCGTTQDHQKWTGEHPPILTTWYCKNRYFPLTSR